MSKYKSPLRRYAESLLRPETLVWSLRRLIIYLRHNNPVSIYYKMYNRRFFLPILDTAPMGTNPDAGCELQSLVSHQDLPMYILCVKSFLRFYDDIAVTVIDDGSLTESDIGSLKYHIKGLRILDVDAVHGDLDRFVKWDRILKRIKGTFSYEPKDKIIILDSDILLLSEPVEMIDWIRNGRDSRLYMSDHRIEYNTREDLKKEFSASSFPVHFNAGLLCMFRADLDKDRYIDILERLQRLPNLVGHDQILLCVVFADKKTQILPEAYYPSIWFPGGEKGTVKISDTARAAHFFGIKYRKIGVLYARYASRVMFEMAGIR